MTLDAPAKVQGHGKPLGPELRRVTQWAQPDHDVAAPQVPVEAVALVL